MVEVIGIETVRRQVAELRGMVAALDPDAVPLPEAAEVWRELDQIGRLADAAKLLLALRVEESKVWQATGCRSAAEFLARQAGGSVRGAREMLRASRRIRELPSVERALRSGELSATQAELVTDAASVDPSREADLVEAAGRLPLVDLARECGRVKAAADPDPEVTYRRVHADRRLRQRVDGEGAWCLSARGTVDVGALVDHALGPLVDEMYDQARTEGRKEHRDAYAFDALVELLHRYLDHAGHGPAESGDDTAEGPTDGSDSAHCAPGVTEERPVPDRRVKRRTPSNPRYLGLIRVDHAALVRGQIEGDELCEISGLGPIPVRVARELLGDAILKLIVTKGRDVANVTHLGRRATEAQRTALLWLSPRCANVACGYSFVQIDHRDGWARTRRTILRSLDRLCVHCHRLKTYDGWGLVDGVGPRAFVPPTDSRHPDFAERQREAA